MTKMPNEPSREAAIAGGPPSDPAESVGKAVAWVSRAKHACPANRKQALHLLSLRRSRNGTGVNDRYSAHRPKGSGRLFLS